MTLCSCAGKEDRNTHNTVSHTRDEQGHRGTIAFCVHKTPSGEAVMSVKEPWDTAGTKEQQCLVLLLLLLHTPCLNPPPPPQGRGKVFVGCPWAALAAGTAGQCLHRLALGISAALASSKHTSLQTEVFHFGMATQPTVSGRQTGLTVKAGRAGLSHCLNTNCQQSFSVWIRVALISLDKLCSEASSLWVISPSPFEPLQTACLISLIKRSLGREKQAQSESGSHIALP